VFRERGGEHRQRVRDTLVEDHRATAPGHGVVQVADQGKQLEIAAAAGWCRISYRVFRPGLAIGGALEAATFELKSAKPLSFDCD
jgi:hypothetical protein